MRSVSVIVASNGRARTLGRTLDGLERLDYLTVEVVAVMGPDDAGMDAVRRAAPESVIWLRCPQRNVGAARNTGIAKSHGEFIALIDDDAVPDAAWLDDVMPSFEDAEVAAAGGPTRDSSGISFHPYRSAVSRAGVPEVVAPGLDVGLAFSSPLSWMVPYPIGTNAVFRRSALAEVGGFDESFTYFLDEAELCTRLIDRGYRIATLDRGVVYHWLAPSSTRTRTRPVSDWRPILANLHRYAHRYGRIRGMGERTSAEIAAYVDTARRTVEREVHLGHAPRNASSDFEAALLEARENAGSATPIPPVPVAAHDCDGFQAFETRGRSLARLGRRRRNVCVIMATDPSPASPRLDHLRALEEATGAIVHVVHPTPAASRVEFDGALWLHRVAAQPGRIDPLLAELRRIHHERPLDHWTATEVNGAGWGAACPGFLDPSLFDAAEWD